MPSIIIQAAKLTRACRQINQPTQIRFFQNGASTSRLGNNPRSPHDVQLVCKASADRVDSLH